MSARIGERQENIFLVCVTLPDGTSSSCRYTVWVLAYVMSLSGSHVRESPVYSRDQRFNAQSMLISVEMVPIRRPKTGSTSREWVAGRKTGPPCREPTKANSSFNAPNFSRNCSLFVQLPSLETGRPRLRRVTQLL